MQRNAIQHEVSEIRRMQLDSLAIYHRAARRAWIAGQIMAAQVEARYEKRSERQMARNGGVL